MELGDRQKLVLQVLVEEYIKLAQPISSQLLSHKSCFYVSTATLRIDLQKLTEEGYLYQPYTSGGRIPTDKGYRFFVNTILTKEYRKYFRAQSRKKILKSCKRLRKLNNLSRLSQELTRTLARLSSVLAVTYLPDLNIFWREGWENIVTQPEFQDINYLRDFVKAVNDFENNIEKFNRIEEKLKVYIGKEIPLSEKELTIIVTKSSFPQKKRGTLALLGPKRMNFSRNIGLINYLSEVIEKF